MRLLLVLATSSSESALPSLMQKLQAPCGALFGDDGQGGDAVGTRCDRMVDIVSACVETNDLDILELWQHISS